MWTVESGNREKCAESANELLIMHQGPFALKHTQKNNEWLRYPVEFPYKQTQLSLN